MLGLDFGYKLHLPFTVTAELIRQIFAPWLYIFSHLKDFLPIAYFLRSARGVARPIVKVYKIFVEWPMPVPYW